MVFKKILFKRMFFWSRAMVGIGVNRCSGLGNLEIESPYAVRTNSVSSSSLPSHKPSLLSSHRGC